MNKNQLISIITVSYNAVSTIEKTILSVINQTYDNIEYIIIDGGSTDGTIEIIKKYEHNISYWISEPDKGIYDAMNKGIKLAKGDWINFMNAGDTFYNNKIINEIFSYHCKGDILYGNVYYEQNGYKIIKKATTPQLSNINLSFCHQSSFVKSSIIKKNPFNTIYKLSADYAMFMSLLSEGFKFIYVDICIAKYDRNGISSNNWKTNYENLLIHQNYNKICFLRRILFYTKFE